MNAVAIPGAKLYFYVTGSDTLATIYSDEALTTPLANPVTADAAGRWSSIYMDSTVTYRIVLKDSSDVTIPGHDTDPYLPNVVDGLTEDLQAIADEVVLSQAAAEAAQAAAEVAEVNAEAAEAAAVAAVAAVRQDIEFALQPNAGLELGAWYASFFVPAAADYTQIRHWVYLGTGTAEFWVSVNDVLSVGPFTAGTTQDSDLVTLTVAPGDKIAFQITALTLAPLALAITLEGLPT
jgi:hypothetical protein